jgi:minor histocompatibility antigen H13
MFNAAMLGYLLGMAATVAVMLISEKAQPALLFLVPGVTFASTGQAYLRSELWAWLNW